MTDPIDPPLFEDPPSQLDPLAEEGNIRHIGITGHKLIADYLKRLDGSPGVYRMLNAANEVLYVGKARNLKNRVSNYARPTGHSARIQRMISETSAMMFCEKVMLREVPARHSSGVLPTKRGPEADRFSSVPQVRLQWSTMML